MPFGELLTDLDLTADDLAPLTHDLLRGEHARASLAILGQQQLAEAEARIQRAHVEGLGELQMRVDAGVYFSMALLFGPDCWRDEAFRADMLRKNPEMRIKSRARKTTLRMPEFSECPRRHSTTNTHHEGAGGNAERNAQVIPSDNQVLAPGASSGAEKGRALTGLGRISKQCVERRAPAPLTFTP